MEKIKEVTNVGLYFVNMEKEPGWFNRFIEQHERSPRAEKHQHSKHTRIPPTTKEEPSLHYVEVGEATININGEVVAKLGTGRTFTGVLVPPGFSVQWNIGENAKIRVLSGEREICEVVAPGGNT